MGIKRVIRMAINRERIHHAADEIARLRGELPPHLAAFLDEWITQTRELPLEKRDQAIARCAREMRLLLERVKEGGA